MQVTKFTLFLEEKDKTELTLKKNKFIKDPQTWGVFDNDQQISAELVMNSDGMFVGRIFKDKKYTGEYETEETNSKFGALMKLQKLWKKYVSVMGHKNSTLQDQYNNLFNQLDDIQKQKVIVAMKDLQAEGEEGFLPAIRYMKRKFNISVKD